MRPLMLNFSIVLSLLLSSCNWMSSNSISIYNKSKYKIENITVELVKSSNFISDIDAGKSYKFTKYDQKNEGLAELNFTINGKHHNVKLAYVTGGVPLNCNVVIYEEKYTSSCK